MKYNYRLVVFLLLIFIPCQVHAQDLSINQDGIRMADEVIEGETIRIYATVENHSDRDLVGTVKFYDEALQTFVGEDQPISVIAGKTDDVFVDLKASQIGDHPISVRILPWEEERDDPENNKVTKILYVDGDFDKDGIGDRRDNDDDNDGVYDADDYFPLSPYESADADHDGIGDNGDTDDDNDGIEDVQDAFPFDPFETTDTDHDGVGDNTDVFPDDPTETVDSDGDGLGDNSDPFKNNHGPIPIIETEKETVRIGRSISFNAINSTDPDGTIVMYKWFFDDGSEQEGVLVDHVFRKKGEHNVILRTTDDKGESKEQTIILTVTYRWQTIALIITSILLMIFIFGYQFFLKGFRKRDRK